MANKRTFASRARPAHCPANRQGSDEGGFEVHEISCRRRDSDGDHSKPSMAAMAMAPAPAAAKPEVLPQKRKLNLRPLASLVPYVKRYRVRALAALGP